MDPKEGRTNSLGLSSVVCLTLQEANYSLYLLKELLPQQEQEKSGALRCPGRFFMVDPDPSSYG